MRNFFFLGASLFCFVLMPGFAAAESPECPSCCEPSPSSTTNPTVPTVPDNRAYCKEEMCNVLGKTSRDRDNQNIIACVFRSDVAGRPASCNSGGDNCIWKVLTTERPFGEMRYPSFNHLKAISVQEERANPERQCLWTGGYKDGRRVEGDGPWKNYFACTHACFHYCKGYGFQSGFIAEWSYSDKITDDYGTSGKAGCSCVY